MNRFAIGEGTAVFVSDTGESVNKADICSDERSDSAIDEEV